MKYIFFVLSLMASFFSYADDSGPFETAQKAFQAEAIKEGTAINLALKKLEQEGYSIQSVLKAEYDGGLSLPSAILSSGDCAGAHYGPQGHPYKPCKWIYTVSSPVAKTASGYSVKSIRADIESDYEGNFRVLNVSRGP